MKRTNVFATDDEKQEINQAIVIAQFTPVMGISSGHMMTGGFAGDARKSMNELIQKTAMAHGLPDVTGYYGYDPSNGEFISAEDTK